MAHYVVIINHHCKIKSKTTMINVINNWKYRCINSKCHDNGNYSNNEIIIYSAVNILIIIWLTIILTETIYIYKNMCMFNNENRILDERNKYDNWLKRKYTLLFMEDKTTIN